MAVKLFKKYKPHEKQIEFHKSDARFKNVCAGVRSGKTFAGGREFIKLIYKDIQSKNKRNFLYWCVAPDYVIGQTQIEEVFKVLTEPFNLHWEDIRKSPLVRYWNENKKVLALVFKVNYKNKKIKKYVRIRFRSAERPESLVADTVDGVWVDEAARMKPAAWPNIRSRLTTTRGWGIFTTTPLGRNWYYEDLFLMGDETSDRYDSSFENFVFYTTDNTAVPGIQEEVELAKKQMPLKYFLRDYMASFETFSGQIYDEFDRKVHLISRKQINEYLKTGIDDKGKLTTRGKFRYFIMGKDWGYTNPGVSLVIAIDGDYNFYVIDLVYKTQLEVVSQSGNDWIKEDRKLMKKYPIEVIFADPSESAYIQSYRKARMPIRQADNTVGAGIQQVATLMHIDEDTKKPKLFIAEDLKELIKELEAYKWKENKDGDLKEEPEKKNDHAMDALRYAIYTFMKKYVNTNITRRTASSKNSSFLNGF